jgi:hypothetical protein
MHEASVIVSAPSSGVESNVELMLSYTIEQPNSNSSSPSKRHKSRHDRHSDADTNQLSSHSIVTNTDHDNSRDVGDVDDDNVDDDVTTQASHGSDSSVTSNERRHA